MRSSGRHRLPRGISPDLDLTKIERQSPAHTVANRWFVLGARTGEKDPCRYRPYTDYQDAAYGAQACSNERHNRKGKVPCLLLGGWGSTPDRVIGRCVAGECGFGASKKDRERLATCVKRSPIRTSREIKFGTKQASPSVRRPRQDWEAGLLGRARKAKPRKSRKRR